MADRMAVIGAGRMGTGMAFSLALAGLRVDLADLKQRSAADRGRMRRDTLVRWRTYQRLMVEAGLLQADAPPVADRIAWHWKPGPWLGRVECLFEALPEISTVKRDAFRLLGPWLAPRCLVGSTTSSIGPDELAGALPHPERFLLTHWLHPPWVMDLVEVAPGKATDPAVTDATVRLLHRAGKRPLVVPAAPGLLVVRLQVLLMNEAARLADELGLEPGVVDQAVRLGIGPRFLVQGPLSFADTGGIDTLCRASRHLRTALNDPKFEPDPAVVKRTARGELGQKSGHGFYDWRREETLAEQESALRTYLRLRRFSESDEQKGE